MQLCIVLFLVLTSCAQPEQDQEASVEAKPRVIVLSDIGNEPDDAQSLVRFLLYTNEIDVLGILATTSTWLREMVLDQRMRDHVTAYGKIRDNLLVHAPGYPTEEELQSKIKVCPAVYGMAAVGEGHDSEGSDHIIEVIDAAEDGPIWLSVWGGANCLAQALWKVEHTRSAEDLTRFIEKIRVYTISDQDDAGPWMRERYPDLFYIVTPSDQTSDDYTFATWVGISGDAFHGNFQGPNFEIVDNPWLLEHIRTNHGPLGERYPATEYLMEGDTPSFFNLINNGLAGNVSPSYGGWGGRYALTQPEGETRPIWTNSNDTVVAFDGNTYTTNHATVWRWREAYQHDFAARMDWTITPTFEDANHNPILVVNGDDTKNPVYIDAAPGSTVTLTAEGSADPDPEDSLSLNWWIYREAGTYQGNATLASPVASENSIEIPQDASGTTLHIILEGVDNGTPYLTSYRRIVININ